MAPLHELIFRLEEGGGKLLLKSAAGGLLVVLLLLTYNWFCFQNFATQEAMDAAQLARNISQGKGFTTDFLRPSSVRLLRVQAAQNPSAGTAWDKSEPGALKELRADISNPPVYPIVLAGLMRVLPFHFSIDLTHRFWSSSVTRLGEAGTASMTNRFRRYQPDFLISALNQVLLLVLAGASFVLARRLFNLPVALLGTGLLVGNDLLWRFAVSGLSTLLCMVTFAALLGCVLRIVEATQVAPDRIEAEGSPAETEASPTSQRSAPNAILWAGLAGAAVGLGALTRYSFGWLIVPLIIFIAMSADARRFKLIAVCGAAFGGVFVPWIVRNWLVSGLPFGTATYAVLEGSSLFPGHDFSRSLEPNLSLSGLAIARVCWGKFLGNVSELVQGDLPSLGGTWVGGFFLLGVLVPFAADRIRRLGIFLFLCVVTFCIVQPLGKTQLSLDSPVVNSENLLVLLVPGIWIYGAAFLLLLLNQINWPTPQVRSAVVGGFSVVTCLPMLTAVIAQRRSPVVFPPYFPPSIVTAAGFVKSDEWMMSDIPWATAWYGQAQSIWLTRTKRDFLVINDHLNPIHALYLTHAAGGVPFQSFDQWITAGQEYWGDLIISCLLQQRQGKEGPPSDFQLEYWQKGWPLYFLLTARDKPVTDANLQ